MPEKTSTEDLDRLYDKTVELIEQRYEEGCIAYLQEFNASLYRSIQHAEDRVHRVADECKEGRAEVSAYREALKGWFQLVQRGIDIYRVARGRKEKEAEAQGKKPVDIGRTQRKLW